MYTSKSWSKKRIFHRQTFKASSSTMIVPPCSHPLRASTTSWSNCLTSNDMEFEENKLTSLARSSLWWWGEAQSKLWFPTSSAIDFMYLFVNRPNSLFSIVLADSVLFTNTCVSPNMLVLKQFPYLFYKMTLLAKFDSEPIENNNTFICKFLKKIIFLLSTQLDALKFGVRSPKLMLILQRSVSVEKNLFLDFFMKPLLWKHSRGISNKLV